jgi:hypothetical protein
VTGFGGVRTILGAELRAAWNRLLKRGASRLALFAVLLLVIAVTVGGGAFAVGATVGHFVPGAEDMVLAGGFTVLSVLMLVIGFPTVIATFFVGRELLQLVLAPVRSIEVFAARLVLAVIANAFISAILLAGMFGLGAGSGAGPAYYPLALLLVVVQILLVTAAQTVLMSVILRWIPARLARDVAAAVAGLAGAGVYLAWNVSLRRSFALGSRTDVSSLTSLAKRIDWLPSSWPGHALSAVIAGDVVGTVLWSLLSILLAAVLLAAAAALYERTLLTGLGVFGTVTPLWRRRAARPTAPSSARGVGSPQTAIARKDWLAVRRDVRRLARLLPAMLFPVGYAVALSRPSRSIGGFWTDVFLVAFMSMFMCTALATPSVPSERRGFQLLRLAPVTMAQVLRAKVVLTLPPVLAVTLLFSLVMAASSGGGAPQLAQLAGLALWLGVGFTTISVSAGAIDPHFDAVDDRRSVGLLGTMVSMFGSLGFALLSLGAFASFVFGTGAAAGTAQLGVLPSTPLVGGLMIFGGVVLVALSATLGTVLVIVAASRLSAFEAPIAEA